ncbi:thioesterase [Termitidicoccus mucosus]|uniref:Thioesterase n=1 Tax=Termitidicoccus mucosus TaxID=1184151 RepID=A0A178IKD2_9BACT|nr:thioesterase [Opitutaceae bacterium TSB47]
MPFTYHRLIHFPDTDAAGVVYFANYLSICHEAYEEALAAAGVDIARFFSDSGVVIPVSKSSADYLRPLVCGDRVSVSVRPSALTPDSFAIDYEVTRLGRDGAPSKLAAKVRTQHVCIRSDDRMRQPLPDAIAAWVNAE